MTEIKEHNNEFGWLDHFIVIYNGVAIGLCQYCKGIDSDEESREFLVEGVIRLNILSRGNR